METSVGRRHLSDEGASSTVNVGRRGLLDFNCRTEEPVLL